MMVAPQGGHLYLKLDIIRVKKFTLLGLFFRTRQCTRVHRLGVQKRAKLEKRVCFWSYDKFWKGHDGQIKEKRMQNTYLGSIFIPAKYVFRGCFESPFTRMISNLKYKWPPPPRGSHSARPVTYHTASAITDPQNRRFCRVSLPLFLVFC